MESSNVLDPHSSHVKMSLYGLSNGINNVKIRLQLGPIFQIIYISLYFSKMNLLKSIIVVICQVIVGTRH